MLLVPRTCQPKSDPKDGLPEKTIPLEETRGFAAYALLGDPGSGKSKAFEQEAAAWGVVPISAGDFLGLDHPELQDASFPIFIDGLDETRAGTANGTVPLDGIRRKLQQLGCRRFRISCRAADWLGQPDTQRLQSLLAEGETVQVFRLQPLTLADVAAILEANQGIADPQEFIATAEQHGLMELMFNPQTLEMLAKAVGSANQWPESRLDTYEMACVRLAQEHNQEHAAATRKTAPNQVSLRRAAAYLCVLYLVADLAGFTHSSDPQDRVLTVNALPNPENLPLDEALASRLFKEIGRDVFAPVHRTVAEFLAARYIAEGLKAKLSLRRFLSLICGSDGGIVSGMRGLSAWLGSVGPAARLTCCRLDPLGVLLYGDARNFTVPDKLALIDALSGQAEFSTLFRWGDGDAHAFSALTSAEMLPAIEQRLTSTDRSDTGLAVALVLLEGLQRASALPPLAPVLLAMVRDASWPLYLRLRASRTYIRYVGVSDVTLRALLDDVHAGTVADAEDELLGMLLAALYPQALPSSAIPQFLHAPKSPNLIGKYTLFWRRDLERVSAKEVPALLDAFAQRPELRRAEATRDYAKTVGGLLVRALAEFGDEVPDDRLLNWLDACCGKHANSLLESDDAQVVRQWLEARPQRYFSLLDIALERYWTESDRAWIATARLHGAKEPADSCLWWLGKAEAAADEARARDCFIRAAHGIPHEGDQGIGRMLTECDRVAILKGWQETLSGVLTCDFTQWGWKLEEGARRKERRQEAVRTKAYFRERLAEFALPLAPLEILDAVTMAYEERSVAIDGDTPMARLNDLFASDAELVQAALQSLRNAIEREDLPTIEQTLQAADNGQVMTLNAPALIGLELRHREDPAFLRTLPSEQLTAALVAHLVHSHEGHDTWVAAAVGCRPQNMADALTAYLTVAMRSQRRSAYGAYRLRQAEYREVAERCLLPLLVQFPWRAHPNVRGMLDDLLHSALDLSVRDELLAIVKVRIEALRMDGPQRACWLASGLLLDPDHYLSLATCYMQNRPQRMRHIAGFLHYRGQVGDVAVAASSKVLGVLIEHFSIGCHPARVLGGHRVTHEMNRADLVRSFINDLAGRSDAESAAQLRRLETIPAISHWGASLRDARMSQQIVRRDATFVRPGWAQVFATLQLGTPTNPAEIAAVVNDTIQDLQEQMRYSDLELHDQYWNTDEYARATVPRHEEVCRNAFGDQLRVRLERFSIGCLPETQHADGKRSDLWCTTALLGVPIEAKNDHHRALWTATKGQLMARYAIDPRAKGHGIYVVFWFGQPSNIPAPPSGVRPTTPQELEAMLEAGLTEEERRMITIHVIDCSVRQRKP
ncbi:MAG: hypothetical protein Q7K57_54665 [Burkholderiaceae bacterium]|nr:hypothetical protein [Burkholderiaceae bacterium]